jgi:hypothetical protein
MDVIGKVFKLAISVLLLAAAAFLATKSAAKHDSLRVFAAVCLAVPGVVNLTSELGELFGAPSSKKRDRVKRSMQSGLMRIYRDKGFPRDDDITQVSFHVWVLPTWYRRLAPMLRWWRGWRKRDDTRRRLRPKLLRLAMFRFEHMPSSKIIFRDDVGLVGRCVALNEPGHASIVRFNSKRFQQALSSDEDWRTSKIDINQNLSRKDAQKLAGVYHQVAAMVIREHSGDPIGCVTLELPKGAEAKFKKPKKDNPDNDPLLIHLRSTALEVESDLRLKIGLQP